jgi:hypothetical protein
MFISKFSTNLKTSSKLSKVSFVFKRSRADIFETFGEKEKTTKDRSTQKGMKKKKTVFNLVWADQLNSQGATVQ